jgi:flagellar biosynthesis protein FlhF
MKVKRFFAESMQAALRQVRDELGADAVILSNTRVKDGIEIVAALDYSEEAAKAQVRQQVGTELTSSPSHIARLHAQRQVQLQEEMASARRRIDSVRHERAAVGAEARTADAAAPAARAEPERKGRVNGIESLLSPELKAGLQAHARKIEPDEPITVIEPPAPKAGQTPREPVKPVPDRLAPRAGVGSDPELGAPDRRQGSQWDALADMREEIQSIKRMLQHGEAPAPEQKPRAVTDLRSRCAQRLGERLSELGLTGQVRDVLLRTVSCEDDFEAAWRMACGKLASLIRVEPAELIDQPGVIALVGPTGSGKTMTIGKLAARYVMKYGGDGIALVTTDRYRIAAHEQLKVFGRILNIPVFTVNEKNGLDDILDRLSHKRLVLVDTAGLQQNDPGWADQMQELKLSRHPIKPYLVLSATGQYQIMCAQYHVYRRAALSGVVLTKVDEAVSLGELLSFLAASRLPVAYVTDGQRVPADLHRPDVTGLLDQAQELARQAERWLRMPAPEFTELEEASGDVHMRSA